MIKDKKKVNNFYTLKDYKYRKIKKTKTRKNKKPYTKINIHETKAK
jgi:hypothetical protein